MAREYELLGDLDAVEDTIDFWRQLLLHIATDVKSAAGERACDADGLAEDAWLARALDRLLPLVATWPLDSLLPGFAEMPKSLLRHGIYIILFSNNDFEKPQLADDHDVDLHLKFDLDSGEFADFIRWSEGRSWILMNLISAGSWSWREYERGLRPGRRMTVARLDQMSKYDCVSFFGCRPLTSCVPGTAASSR